MLIQLRELHPNLSDPDFLLLLRASGKYKQRSDQTHDFVHEPLLTENPLEPIWCLLLGDSMLERLKTTGAHTDLGKGQFPHIFNAGVGGDRIQNVLYRLDTKGLFWDLKSRRVKYAVLQMGTNDLAPKRGLNSATLTQYSLVVEALHRATPGIKILVTGLMPRTDVDEVSIHRSNQDLRNLVQGYNELVGQKLGLPFFLRVWCAPVHYMPPHPAISTNHLVDHAHLNEEGYTLFAEALWTKLQEMEDDARHLLVPRVF